jgi:exopolysaccharide biosynthesis protein
LRSYRRIVPAIAFCLAPSLPTAADTIKRTVAPGIEFTQETVAPPAGPLIINVLRINLKQPGVRVQAELAQDVVLNDDPTLGRETVGATAVRHGAVAAVNADFFPYTGDPLSLTIRNGELLSESMPHRVAMSITSDGDVRFDTLLTVGSLMAPDGSIVALEGINRLLGKDEIVVETPAFGARTRATSAATTVQVTGVNLPVRVGQDQTGSASEPAPGDPKSPIPAGGAVLVGSGKGADWLRSHVHQGDSIRFRFDCVPNPLPAGPYRKDLASRAASSRGRAIKSVWTDVQQAVGGGPWLVRDGRPAVDGDAESFDEREFVAARHPRTAVGATSAGELLLVNVDGRNAGVSRGATLPEMADILIRYGAARAINLDGGGSTTMVVNGAYVNRPSDGEPNAVAASLLVFAPTSTMPPTVETLDPITVPAGGRVTLGASPNGAAGSADQIGGIWGTLDGRAFVTQTGVLTATRAGAGAAVCTTNGKTIRAPYTVISGPPAKLRAVLGSAPNNPPDRNILSITVTDAYGNPVPNQTVHVQSSGGSAEQPEAVTDSAGRATVEIVWDIDKGRKVTVSSGSLNSVTITSK